MLRLPPLCLLPLLAAACEGPDLSQSWEIDRLRILAVKAEPAEPGPGDVVTFDALVLDPEDRGLTVMWFACLATDADDYGCGLDMSGLGDLEALLDGVTDPSQLTPEQVEELYAAMEAAGLMGVSPYFPPTYTIPEDILDGLSEAERQEGLNLMVTLMAIPDDATSDADMELAYKRVPVSDAATPNQNPDIVAFKVNDSEMLSGMAAQVTAGTEISLEPILSDTSVESYKYLSSAGEAESRTEEPYFVFYMEQGEMDPNYSIFPESTVQWAAPATPAEGTTWVWTVVQDRRGGMGWWAQELAFQ